MSELRITDSVYRNQYFLYVSKQQLENEFLNITFKIAL